MGVIKNKDDVAHYSMRLNLTNPDHLLIHQTMQKLNKEVYKSQNNFIIESVLRNIQNYTKEELMSDEAIEKARENGYVTRKDLESMEKAVSEKVMKEVVTLLCSSLAGRNAGAISPDLVQKAEVSVVEKPNVDTDETLSNLSDMWS